MKRTSRAPHRLRAPAWRPLWAAVAAAVVLGLSASAMSAQTPGLDRVEELIRDGRVLEARLALDVWWATERMAARPARLERAIWLRARTTHRADQAEFLLHRLVLEFPDGPYAEGARERLSLLEAAKARQPADTGERSGSERER